MGVDFSNLPVVVLLNRESASGSELVGSAIKTTGRGIIIGDDTTSGKGTIISTGLFPASLSSGQFFSVDGSSVEEYGLSSDLIIPSTTMAKSADFNRNKYSPGKTSNKNKNVYTVEEILKNYAMQIDYGFRDSDIIKNLSKNYTKKLLADTESLSYLAYKFLLSVTKINNVDTLVNFHPQYLLLKGSDGYEDLSQTYKAAYNLDLFSISTKNELLSKYQIKFDHLDQSMDLDAEKSFDFLS